PLTFRQAGLLRSTVPGGHRGPRVRDQFAAATVTVERRDLNRGSYESHLCGGSARRRGRYRPQLAPPRRAANECSDAITGPAVSDSGDSTRQEDRPEGGR